MKQQIGLIYTEKQIELWGSREMVMVTNPLALRLKGRSLDFLELGRSEKELQETGFRSLRKKEQYNCGQFL